ncbi:hypothetical protein NIES2100_16670 [Calothrix sp. NIES-2100]|uniref:hypothetical protein n=1 Tax=Calothrix sp. NIES-2100 TaxID=1954172 RepID=UPI000B5E9C0F|nr:hypothetical protein NIES2100_16670 [Calothrix sp. NIES-2100]
MGLRKEKILFIRLLATVSLFISSCNIQICLPLSTCKQPVTYQNQPTKYPSGIFISKDGFFVSFDENTQKLIIKHPKNTKHNHSFQLIKIQHSIDNSNKMRHLYFWHNQGYQYKVAWRPKENPDIIRLEIFGDGDNVNTLLTKDRKEHQK